MKLNLFLAIVVIALGYITCKNLQKTPSTTNPTGDPNTYQNSGYNWKTSHVAGSNADTAAPLQIKAPPRMVQVPIASLPVATASRKAYLTDGLWHCNMAYQPSDTTIHVNYQHKWLRFREDQTFDILLDQKKVLDTGRWAWDEQNNHAYLSCNDPYINNSWAVQDKGFTMIWKGNTELNVTGIQIRMICARGSK
jgi:hypothetical protein